MKYQELIDILMQFQRFRLSEENQLVALKIRILLLDFYTKT